MTAADAMAFLIDGARVIAEAARTRADLVQQIAEMEANGAPAEELARARHTLKMVDRQNKKSQASFDRSRRVIYREWPHLKPENTPHG